MAAGRLVLVLGSLGILGIVLAQNTSASLRLVLLGQPTIALPLGVWLVLAGLAGAGTTGVFIALFRWSNHLARQATKRELRADTFGNPFPESPSPAAAASPTSPPRDVAGEPFRAPPRPSWPWSAAPPMSPPSPSPSRTSPPMPAAPASTATSAQPASRPTEVWDDWAVDDRDRDWDDAPPTPNSAPPRPAPTTESSRSEGYRETPPDPSPSRSSSVYSYSSQQLRHPAVERFSSGDAARTEAIYDAEYRVIIPPYRDLAEDTMTDEDAGTDYADADDIEDINDEYDEPDVETEGNDEDAFEDEDEELGDEVFDDWEEEPETPDWPRR